MHTPIQSDCNWTSVLVIKLLEASLQQVSNKYAQSTYKMLIKQTEGNIAKYFNTSHLHVNIKPPFKAHTFLYKFVTKNNFLPSLSA